MIVAAVAKCIYAANAPIAIVIAVNAPNLVIMSATLAPAIVRILPAVTAIKLPGGDISFASVKRGFRGGLRGQLLVPTRYLLKNCY